MARKVNKYLEVKVTARTLALVEEAIESLARAACDVANSMDESVHVSVCDLSPRGRK